MTTPVSLQKQSVPPTPMKKRPHPSFVPQSPEAKTMALWTAKKPKVESSPYETLFQTISGEKTLSLYGVKAKLERIGQGYFMHTFAMKAETEILPDIANDTLLVKFYHGAKGGFGENRLSTYTSSSLRNYETALSLNLPVAQIHNADTALQDRYFLVERIPHEIEMPQDIEKVHQFFKAAFANKVYFDLHPSNLRKREDGTVTLIDFVEEKINFKTSSGSECACRITALLTAWAERGASRAEGEQIVKRLTAGLEEHGFDPQWAEDALQTAHFSQETIQPKT